jgi:hypothetical protein
MAAVTTLGAPPAPASSIVPIVTRTRREFGGLLLADGRTLTVTASRRVRECVGVNLQANTADGGPVLHDVLQPAEARLLARALIEAAAAVEQAQRRPVFTRQGGAA